MPKRYCEQGVHVASYNPYYRLLRRGGQSEPLRRACTRARARVCVCVCVCLRTRLRKNTGHPSCIQIHWIRTSEGLGPVTTLKDPPLPAGCPPGLHTLKDYQQSRGWGTGYEVLVERLRAHRILSLLGSVKGWQTYGWWGRFEDNVYRWTPGGWRGHHCTPISLPLALDRLYGNCLLSVSKQRWPPGKQGLCLIHHYLPRAYSESSTQ